VWSTSDRWLMMVVHSLSTLLYVCMTCKAPPLLCRKRQANRILYSMKDGPSVSATESLSPGFIASDILYIEKSVLHFQDMTRRKEHRRSSDYFKKTTLAITLHTRTTSLFSWYLFVITWLEHSRNFQGCVLWGVQLSFILISLPIVGTRDGEIMFMNYEASDITITGSQQPKSWTVSAWIDHFGVGHWFLLSCSET